MVWEVRIRSGEEVIEGIWVSRNEKLMRVVVVEIERIIRRKDIFNRDRFKLRILRGREVSKWGFS